MIDVPDRVKDALRSGGYKKEYYIKIYNGNTLIKTLDNSYLVSESVKFDERMCSDSELKFGLCEGTSVEFQYFDYESILNRRIDIRVNVQYKDASNNLNWYEIPMGWYDVKSVSRQASTGIWKATAYNKLQSTYLDQDVRRTITDIVDAGGSNGVLIYDILSDLLEGFGIQEITEIPLNPGVLASNSDNARYIYCAAFCPVITHEDWQGQITGYDRMIGSRYAIYYEKFTLKARTGYDSNKYYRVAFHLNEFKQLVQDVLSQYSATPIWIGPNNDVASGDATCGTTLDEYVKGNYAYSSYLRGYVDLQFTDGTHRYYSLYPTGGTYDLGFITNIALGSFSTSEYGGIGVDLYIPFYKEQITIPNDSVANDATMYYAVTNPSSTILGQSNIMLANIYYSMQHNPPTYALSYAANVTEINTQKLYPSDVDGNNDAITLRDLQSAVFEINCQYGKLDRVTDLFSGIELNNGGLYPADNLYPANGLYPQGTAEAGYPAMYSKLWADEGNVRSFRYLIITYKAVEGGQEVEKTLQRTVNANGTDDYNMSDNWLFRNLVWTAAQVGNYADAMVAKMQNIRWFPFEMWCAGLPYLESGDAIEIMMSEGTYKSYVLRRTLSGIQNLQDEMINGTLDIF